MIKNGKDQSLEYSLDESTLPNMESTMDRWFVDMTFTRVTTTVVNHVVQETTEDISFRGTWQVLSAREIMLKPEQQRKNTWYQVHSDTALELEVDEIIRYKGTDYRVMKMVPHEIYGYLEYHLVPYREEVE